MKTRTNQPIFYDNGEKVDDGSLGGGTKLYKHELIFSSPAISFVVITDSISQFSIQGGPPKPTSDGNIISVFGLNSVVLAGNPATGKTLYNVLNWNTNDNKFDLVSLISSTLTSDTVTPL